MTTSTDFTFQATASGYMLFYRNRPLGGAGIKGSYRGSRRAAQIEANVAQAKRLAQALAEGRGPKYMQDVVAKYRSEENI